MLIFLERTSTRVSLSKAQQFVRVPIGSIHNKKGELHLLTTQIICLFNCEEDRWKEEEMASRQGLKNYINMLHGLCEFLIISNRG